jgi:glycosyltransferase involved in cell wall biosynthesis
MKIAQVDVNYNLTSTGKIVAQLVSGLEEMGHSAIACYGRGPDFEAKNVHKISSNAEVLLHVLGTRLTGLTDHFSPLSTRRLIGHLENFRPDVVHLHDLHGYFLNIPLVVDFLKINRIPTVWTFHCEFMYTGKCGYAFDCEKWKTECGVCPSLKEYPKSLFFDFTTHMFHEKQKMFSNFEKLYLVAPSEWLANRMRKSIVKDKPIGVIHNGLDINIFRRRLTTKIKSHLGLTNEFIILSVGADLMSERKGGKWVLELAKRNSDKNIFFVMVGVDKEPDQIPSNVKVISRVLDQDILAEYYSMADVLLLTSERETFSMVCAESLACGLPIIGFDSGAPKEVALPGFGKFVPYGDIGALETLLSSVKAGQAGLKSPEECERFARDRYSKESMIKSYVSIYQKLINNQS